DAPLEQRVIIIMLHSDSKSFPSSVSVLDFNGMTTTVVEKDFRVWADPEAAQRRRPKGKLDVQGGHGNGGKCYMTMVFDEHALLHTVKAGKGCRYGVRGGTVQFGYVPDRQSGRVFVMHNGTVVPKGAPLTLDQIPPDLGFAEDRVIDIPAELIDPSTADRVSTTADGNEPTGALTLKSSAVSMRWSRKLRHVINYRAKSGFIGYRPVLEFDINSPAKERIYGDCSLMSLEPLRQNRRAELANSPLTRAVEAFIA